MKVFRIILALTFAAATCLMLAATLTVPSIAATGPAILTLGLGFAAWKAWPS